MKLFAQIVMVGKWIGGLFLYFLLLLAIWVIFHRCQLNIAWPNTTGFCEFPKFSPPAGTNVYIVRYSENSLKGYKYIVIGWWKLSKDGRYFEEYDPITKAQIAYVDRVDLNTGQIVCEGQVSFKDDLVWCYSQRSGEIESAVPATEYVIAEETLDNP